MVEIDVSEEWTKMEKGECDVFRHTTKRSKVELVFGDECMSVKAHLKDQGIQITTPGIEYTEVYDGEENDYILQDNESIIKIRNRTKEKRD